MPVKQQLLLILLLSLGTSAQALERRYLASMDESSWNLTENSRIACRVEHQIPLFGSAAFVQEAGRGLRLELNSRRRFARGINVELRAEPTSWNSSSLRPLLARFETSGRPGLFEIPSRVATQTFHELRQGYQPGFLFYDEDPFVALLSTVRFGEAEAVFKRCVEQLHDINFDDVRVSSIHFEPDNEFASIEEEETAFATMLDYLQVDSSISEIVVSGHADYTGLACYNEGLSERRAWYVYDLLVARGIDSSLLRVDYFGEQVPAKKGSNDRALSANRRVTVELRR